MACATRPVDRPLTDPIRSVSSPLPVAIQSIHANQFPPEFEFGALIGFGNEPRLPLGPNALLNPFPAPWALAQFEKSPRRVQQLPAVAAPAAVLFPDIQYGAHRNGLQTL